MIQVNQSTKTYNTYDLTDAGLASSETKSAEKVEETAAAAEFDRLLSGLKTEDLDQWMVSGNDYRNKLAKQVVSLQGGSSYLGMALQLKQDITNVLENGLGSDIDHIRKMGYDPEKISLCMFTRVMDSNKSAVTRMDTGLIRSEMDSQMAAFKDQLGNVNNMEAIIDELNNQQVAVNKTNIEKVQSTLEKKAEVTPLSEETLVSALKQECEPTLDSLYQSKYKNYNTPFVTIDYEAIEAQIKEALMAAGMDPVGDLGLAKKILAQGLPLNQETLEKTRKIRQAVAEWPEKAVIEEAVKNLSMRKAAGDIPLLKSLENTDAKALQNVEKFTALVDQTAGITDYDVEKTVESGAALNLGNLMAMHMANSGSSEGTRPVLTSEQELKSIKATLQLEEIRLKLTYESAANLSNKGISVETAPIEAVVEGLRALEQETYASYLQFHQVPVNPETMTRVTDVMNRINSLEGISDTTLVKAAGRQIEFSIGAMSEDTLKEAAFAKAMTAYETMETKPRTDMGDRIEKAFSQIDGILKDLGMEVTTANADAVKILARSGMALTGLNIESIKLVSGKVNQLTGQVHPGVIAQMIKDQVSPLSMHVDEVLEYAKGYQETFGTTTKDKIGSMIYDMDVQGALSEDERTSLVGIYRMFSEVDRSKGAAVGFLVKNDLPVNMEQLFEAAKYLKKTRGQDHAVEAVVDDAFGLLEALSYPDTSIKAQAMTALEGANALPTPMQMEIMKGLQAFGTGLSAENVMKGLNVGIEIEQIFQDYFVENEEDGLKMNGQIAIDEFKTIEAADAKLLERLVSEGATGNLKTIRTALAFQNNPFILSDTLGQVYEQLGEGGKSQRIKKLLEDPWRYEAGEISPEAFSETVESELTETADDVFDLGLDRGVHVHKQIKEVLDIMDYKGAGGSGEAFYQIPVMVDGRIGQINLLYMPGRSESEAVSARNYKVAMDFKSETHGAVQVTMEVEGDRLSVGSDGSTLGLRLVDEIKNRQSDQSGHFQMAGIDQTETSPLAEIYELARTLLGVVAQL